MKFLIGAATVGVTMCAAFCLFASGVCVGSFVESHEKEWYEFKDSTESNN